jgi:hypothetical protein
MRSSVMSDQKLRETRYKEYFRVFRGVTGILPTPAGGSTDTYWRHRHIHNKMTAEICRELWGIRRNGKPVTCVDRGGA